MDQNLLIHEIVSLLKDKDLQKTKAYKPLRGGSVLEVPILFHDDCVRTDGLSYNGDHFFNVKKGVSALVKQELIPQSESDKPENQEVENKHFAYKNEENRQLIIEHLIGKLGQPLFNKIGTIINQSFSSKAVDDLINPLQMEIISSNEYNGLETRTISKYEILHGKENDRVSIFARILITNAFIQNGKTLDLGNWGIRREITSPIEELEKFKDFSPNLQVKELVTDLNQDKNLVAAQLKLKIS